jgi:transposase
MILREEWMNIRNAQLKGISIMEISRKYNINWRTARKYARAEEPPKYKRKPRGSKLDLFKLKINGMLEDAPYTAKAIYEKICELGYTGKYGLVKEYARSIKKEKSNIAVMRFETMPGKQAQVDWGQLQEILDINGKKKKIYFFSMILGYSRTRYIEFTTSMNTLELIKCHINAFHYFGGYPDEILYDNMKQVVLKRLVGNQHKLNPLFADFAGYYGFKPILARPYKPRTKGKIERTIGYVKQDFIPGLKYNSLCELNNLRMGWLNKVNSKIHCTTLEKPSDRLKKEKLNLIKNRRDYEYQIPETRKVSKDCLVSYKNVKYSIPPICAGKQIEVKKQNDIQICFNFKGREVAKHNISNTKNMVINKEHFRSLYKKYNIDIDDIDLSVYEETMKW